MAASLQHQQRTANIVHTFSLCFERLSWPLLLLGVLLRLTVRDRIPYLSAAFYATPPVILAALALILMFWHLARKNRRLASLAAVLAAFSVIATVHGQVRFASPRSAGSHDSIVLWNMRNFASGWTRPIRTLRQMQPDIAGIVEGGWPELAGHWQAAFPEYRFSHMHQGLAVMTRGTILAQECGDLGPNGSYLAVQIDWQGDRYRIYVVDLLSTPTVSRRPALVRLAELTKRHHDEPVLVMGDFNMPRDSAHFELLRSEFRHTFSTAGVGYAATWPLPLPVLDLDHIWANNKVAVASCRHGCTLSSDHRPVMLQCQVDREAPAAVLSSLAPVTNDGI